MTDELNIFCRLPFEVAGEVHHVVAGTLGAHPGEVIVQLNDDNDYWDQRITPRKIEGAAGIKFRESADWYPWETAMVEIKQEAMRGLNG